MQYVRNAAEQIVVLAVLAVLRFFDLAGPAPFWVFVLLLGAGGVLQQPPVQRRLAGDAPGGRLWFRVASRIAFNTTLIYAIGWGAMLAVAHLGLLSRFVRQDGARAWRPLAVCSAVSLLLGQVAIALGLFSYLPQPEVHGVATLIALGIFSTSAVLGEAVQRREQAESALRQSEELFRTMVQDGADVITLTEADGSVRFVSPNAERILGRSAESLLGDAYWKILHPDDLEASRAFVQELVDTPGAEQTIEVRILRADGVWRWHEVVLRNLFEHQGVGALLGHHRDVHDRRTTHDQVAHAATHDALTGVLNSAAFQLSLERALADGATGGYPVGVLFLDLDGFKQVNDALGHAAGDETLRLVGRALTGCCRDRDVVGRIGGDEFAVLLNGVAGSAQAEELAASVIARVDDEQAADRPRVGCSVGIAIAAPGTSDVQALLRQADAAMYVSKRRGRNGYEVAGLGTGSAPGGAALHR